MANFQVRLDQAIGTRPIYNVGYWQLENDTPAALQAFANTVRASYLNNDVHTIMSDEWTLQSVTMRQMDGGGPFSQTVGFTLGPIAGLVTGPLLPCQDAVLVSTAAIGPRPNRGRIYFGGLTEETNVGDGEVDPTHGAILFDLVTDWANGISTAEGGADFVIARPDFVNNVWEAFNPIDTVLDRLNWATQRRRRKGSN